MRYVARNPMPRLLRLRLVTVILGVAATACSATPSPNSRTSTASSSASAPAASSSENPPSSGGLSDPHNDPAIVALARGVLGCHWKVGHGYSDECPPGVAWYKTELFHDKKSLPTLVSFLEDADPAVRAIAAEALRVYGHEYQNDSALCARIVGAAEREKDPEMLPPFGDLVGAIDLEQTHLVDRALALAKSAPVALRVEQIPSLVTANPYSLTAFAFVTSALQDPEPRVRAAAITALGEADDAEACELLEHQLVLGANAVGTEEAYVAARALTYGGNGGCRQSFGAVLGWLEKVDDPIAINRLSEIAMNLCRDRTATLAEDARGAKILRKLAMNERAQPGVRADALRALPKCDVDSKTFAGKFKAADEELARVATEVASAPSEAEGPAPDTVGPDDPEPPALDAAAPIRAYDAVSFLSLWDSTPGPELMAAVPPGAYRIDGTVVGLSSGSKGRLELSLVGPPGTAIHLHFSASQAVGAGKKRRGQKAKAVCQFHGDGGRGYANFTDCHWEG